MAAAMKEFGRASNLFRLLNSGNVKSREVSFGKNWKRSEQYGRRGQITGIYGKTKTTYNQNVQTVHNPLANLLTRYFRKCGQIGSPVFLTNRNSAGDFGQGFQWLPPEVQEKVCTSHKLAYSMGLGKEFTSQTDS